MTSGRVIAERALKVALGEVGWRARAAGWFTKDISPDATAVLAASAASKYHEAGLASVTINVGLRVESIEVIVEDVTGPCRPVYTGRTVVQPLGYLLPERSFSAGERDFSQRDAEAQAASLVKLVVAHAEPELIRLASDRPLLAARVQGDVVSDLGPAGMCRVAVLLALTQGVDAARNYVEQRVSALGDRSDAAAVLERDSRVRVLDALEGL